MRWALGLAAVGGCNWVYGLDATRLRDAKEADATPDAPGCADHEFANAVDLPGAFQDGRNYDPVLATPLELWLVRRDVTYDLFVATRDNEQAAFGPAIVAPALNTDLEEISPSFSADGLDLAFVSDGKILLATRPSVSSPFGPAAPVASLATVNGFGGGVALSYDGLALYYSDGLYDLRVVTRPDRLSPFGAPGERLAQGIKWFGLSPDQLELYYCPVANVIQRMTHTNPTAPFESPRMVTAGTDPQVTSDAMRLLYSDGGTIKVATRVCR